MERYGNLGSSAIRSRTCLVIALLIAASATWADEPQFSVGAKLWFPEWTSWTPVETGHNTIQIIQSISSNTHLAVIPQVSVRYDDFLATASYFSQATFTLGGAINPATGNLYALSATRKEFDGNLGYYILPSVAVTVGYKQIDQDFADPSLPYRWRGPTIGVSASSVLRGPLALYGAFAYGRLRMDSPAQDAAGDDHYNADYILAELGLSYRIGTRLSRLSFAATAGYRAQVVSTRRFNLSTGFDGYEPVDVHDVTYGPAISVLGRF